MDRNSRDVWVLLITIPAFLIVARYNEALAHSLLGFVAGYVSKH
jgi:hypothetical protein